MARRDAKGVRLRARDGNDFTKRFPLIVAAVVALPVRSCLIDGEAIVSDESGLAVFDLLRSWPTNLSAVLCAFDLLELDGQDLRRSPIEMRGAGLAMLLHKRSQGIALNEHFVGDGEIVYQQACKLDCEGVGTLSRAALRSIEALPQGQEPGGTGSAARGGGRLGSWRLDRPQAKRIRHNFAIGHTRLLEDFVDVIRLWFRRLIRFMRLGLRGHQRVLRRFGFDRKTGLGKIGAILFGQPMPRKTA